VIRPAIESGRDVVCDRFVDSTVAYQGVARGLGVDLVESTCEVAIAGCKPHVTVLLRIEPEAAESRGQQRLAAGQPDGDDRFELEGIELQRLVADAYEDLASRHPERIVVVDAGGGVEAVHERVMEAVRARS
jgi:dTMP kinase